MDRQNQFSTVLTSNAASFTAVLAAVTALLPIADLDRTPFDVTAFGDRAVIFVEDLANTVRGHLGEVDARRAAAQAHLDAHDTAVSPGAAVAALQSAASSLLGQDFYIVPEFGMDPAQGGEWANAVGASDSGQLLDYLVTTAGIEFPVDEWMCGVARVRPMMRTWEAISALVDALLGPSSVPALLPVQFPYEAGAPWVAMELRPDYSLTSDRLCYTAHYAVPFDPTVPQCGLLVDEWTEVIPSVDRTTGITFNFDRPDNEPPQTILVVTPASGSGQWQWDDILGALNETLDLAKQRGVEPVQLDATPYSMFVPATITAATLYGISIATNLAAANNVMRILGTTQ